MAVDNILGVNVMRAVLIAMLGVTLIPNVSTLAQQPGQATQFGSPISRREVLELPIRDAPPKISLQRALQIARAFIKTRKLDVSSCYLFEAILASGETQNESSWRFWWVAVGGQKAIVKDVKITVAMDGKARLQ